ncbi:thioredoxin domain-containing protein [Caulobacter segnis]|jgi:thioredoxin 2|uniref:thioredoxin domain-containing protein n=1 Tax=Caulobacter segnis TaxID=88688 RepID=UPI001CBD062D|nr:thioredoxin domain-containing protein [Caulobacter segnis]UAL09392.1 thiol reductase thioredoxin [Caulobacter segnis]
MSQVVCVACGAGNRLPRDRDPLSAKCGRCKASLFTGAPTAVTGADLDRHRRLTTGVALLLDVWAPWCGPCRTMAPNFEAAARQLEPAARLLKLDSEAEPVAAGALNVSSIPTLILFRDGQPIARQAGAMSAAQIVDWTRRALA